MRKTLRIVVRVVRVVSVPSGALTVFQGSRRSKYSFAASAIFVTSTGTCEKRRSS